jgi:hypothetical protein
LIKVVKVVPWINVRLIEIEGMAMNGLIKNVEVVNCDKPKGWKRIIATAVDGRKLASECMEPDAARRNYMVFTLYAKKWGKSIFTGEEVVGEVLEE